MAQNTVSMIALRESVDALQQDWSELGSILRPEYETTAIDPIGEIMAPLAMLKVDEDTKIKDSGPEKGLDTEMDKVGVFASFNPDLHDF